MFNISLKSENKQSFLRRNQSRVNRGQQEQMTSQVKKILEQKGQGLIVMVRS